MNKTIKNRANKWYKAFIKDVLKDTNNEITGEIKISVPEVHYGLPTEHLPIALPFRVPGVQLDLTLLEEQLEEVSYVYVFFESGNTTKPQYILPYYREWDNGDQTINR